MLLVVMLPMSVVGQSSVDIAKLEMKAKSFVQVEEWNSANAMYILMMEQHGNDAKNYAGAIVTSGLVNDDEAQIDILERAQRRGLSMDSVFNDVYKFSFTIGQSQEYEKFLKLVKSRNEWLSRHINIRLLKYYDFRNDASNMVAVGNELLVATPDDVKYLKVVARGYMIKSDYEKAVATYKRILELIPDDYDTLVALGNYYYVMWKSAEGSRSQMTEIKTDALNYLCKAYDIRPTVFLTNVIEELTVF